MDINKILNADYLDILFEGRNKRYGGYELRKKYQKRAAVAGLISVLVVGGLFGSTLIKAKEPIVEVAPTIKDVKLADPPPVDPKKPPPPPPVQPPPPVKPTVKFTPPVIKENKEVREEDKPEPPKPDKPEVVGPKTNPGSNDVNAIDPGLNTNPGKGNGPIDNGPVKEQIFTSVEQMPEFPGGPEALRKYLANNIKYPAAAREDGIQGKVVLQFVVDKDGSVTNIVVQRELGGGCTKEAVRVVGSMPKWRPGKQNDKAVKVYYTLPVTFKLGE